MEKVATTNEFEPADLESWLDGLLCPSRDPFPGSPTHFEVSVAYAISQAIPGATEVVLVVNFKNPADIPCNLPIYLTRGKTRYAVRVGNTMIFNGRLIGEEDLHREIIAGFRELVPNAKPIASQFALTVSEEVDVFEPTPETPTRMSSEWLTAAIAYLTSRHDAHVQSVQMSVSTPEVSEQSAEPSRRL